MPRPGRETADTPECVNIISLPGRLLRASECWEKDQASGQPSRDTGATPSPSRACRGPQIGHLAPCALVSPSGTSESGLTSNLGSTSSWKELRLWGQTA